MADETHKPTARGGTRGTSTPADIAAQSGSTQATPQSAGLTPAQLVQAETNSTPEMIEARRQQSIEQDRRLGLNVPQALPAAADGLEPTLIWHDLDGDTVAPDLTRFQADFVREMGTYYAISVRAALARVEEEIAHPMTLNPQNDGLEAKRRALKLTMARIESIQNIMTAALEG